MGAQPALDFIPPNYSAWLRHLMHPLMPLITTWQSDLAEVESHNVETLAKLYGEFAAGKTRLMLAFRHPSSMDPYALSSLLWRDLPMAARKLRLQIGTPHSHFIYDRGIPLWAGSYLGWVFSHLGGVPIQRGKLDLMALKTARQLFVDGDMPLAAAPEGGNNGHNEIVSPLEPGIAQLAFWCAEDLKSQRRDESVVILPIGIQYRYFEAPWPKLEKLIGRLEANSGLGEPTTNGLDSLQKRFEASGIDLAANALGEHTGLYRRLYRLAEHMLSLMEGYYEEFYGATFSEPSGETPNSQLAARLTQLMDEALRVAETYFGLRAKGSVIDRCRKVEQAGWDRIFREGTETLSQVQLGLADRVAEEASLRMWHMRLVESFVAVTGHYVKEKPSAERFAETTLLLGDMMAKIMGKGITRHPYLGEQKAIVTVGEPMRIDTRIGEYQKKRRQAIATVTKDLQNAMESLILPN